MISLSSKISKNFALEINGLYKIRNFKDGVDFFELYAKLDLFKEDHKPSFQFWFEIFNFLILDIHIYNINHVKYDEIIKQNLLEGVQ